MYRKKINKNYFYYEMLSKQLVFEIVNKAASLLIIKTRGETNKAYASRPNIFYL